MKGLRVSHLIVFSLLLVMLTLVVIPAEAQGLRPSITITPVWRPGTTLDTPVSPTTTDNIKYVDVQIYVTTTVPFWAMEMTCSVNNAALDPYDYQDGGDPPDTDPGNDVPPILMGPAWGVFGAEYISVPNTDPLDPNTDADQLAAFTAVGANLTVRLTASRLADPTFTNPPLGQLGSETNFLLATIRYRVGVITPAMLTSPFNCTNIAFLDRNGRSVTTARYTAPPPLQIIKGYTLTGKAFYQARTNHTGIQVGCDGPDGDAIFDFTAATNSAGAFSQTGIRSLGRFECFIFGNVTSPGPGADLHLEAYRSFELVTNSYTLQPVTLRTGNVDQDGTFPEAINVNDLALITGIGPLGVAVPANEDGDANGDRRRDRSDLALVAGNFGLIEDVDGSATLYSLARTFTTNQTFTDYRVFLGDPSSGDVVQLVTGNNRDFWPATSPDGSRIAMIRSVGGSIDNNPATNPPPAFALFTVASTGTGAATRLTPTSFGPTFAAFAPSWSPDGQRIAFMCATDDAYFDSNAADVCVIDANGRNFRQLDLQGLRARIFPPAWLNNDAIVISVNNAGDATLQTFSLSEGDFAPFDNDIAAGGDQEDMPVIQDGLLFYHSISLTGDELRIALIDPTDVADPVDVVFTPRAGHPVITLGDPFHTQAAFDDGGGVFDVIIDLDYYEVSETGANLMYSLGGDFFTNAYIFIPADNVPAYGSFSAGPPPLTHIVDSQFSDFPGTSFGFALRNTVDWVP